MGSPRSSVKTHVGAPVMKDLGTSGTAPRGASRTPVGRDRRDGLAPDQGSPVYGPHPLWQFELGRYVR
jgi:hypothetical protein